MPLVQKAYQSTMPQGETEPESVPEETPSAPNVEEVD